MQKEKTNLQSETSVNDLTDRTTPKPLQNESGSSAEVISTEPLQTGKPETEPENSDNDTKKAFEDLIKGPYKEAFAAKVQGIINKRFKEEKQKQNTNHPDEKSDDPIVDGDSQDPDTNKSDEIELDHDPAMQALLKAGIDPQTAYRTLHFDEIVDVSARLAASLAAKQLADNIRLKGARPAENGTNKQNGFAPHRGAAGLTPEKRREMAEKALMGHHIGF